MATRATHPSSPGERSRLSAGSAERLYSTGVFILIVSALVIGWVFRERDWIDPELGFGYALGIIGSSMMLLLLVYPIRKRLRRASASIGSVGFWFRFHMLLGLFGPLAILYHARFTWGSLNSSVALACMIVVAASGLVGRFLYSRVHRGYSGRKLEVRSLRQEMDASIELLEAHGFSGSRLLGELQSMEEQAVRAGSAFWTSARSVVGLGIRTRRVERQLRAALGQQAGGGAGETRETLAHFFEAVRRAAEFAFYDRMLRLWHLLHLPLFVLLVAAAILHVVAVHMY